MLRIVGGDSKQETYVVTHTTSGIYILIAGFQTNGQKLRFGSGSN